MWYFMTNWKRLQLVKQSPCNRHHNSLLINNIELFDSLHKHILQFDNFLNGAYPLHGRGQPGAGGGGEDGGERQRKYLQTQGRVSRELIYSSCRVTIG